jgi:hypothetical protein
MENIDLYSISMYMDSGAGTTIVNNKEFLSRYLSCSFQFIAIGDGNRIQVKGQGELLLHVADGTIKTEALYVPEITVQLLSISQLAKDGTIAIFDDKGVVFTQNNVVIGKGRIQGEDYIVDGQIPVTHMTNTTLATPPEAETTIPPEVKQTKQSENYKK